MRQIASGIDPMAARAVEVNRRDRRLLAFARTAASIAGTAELQTVLDDVTCEARAASGAATCALIADRQWDDHPVGGPLIGAAGEPAGFRLAIGEAARCGAPFLTVGTDERRGPRIHRNLPQLIAADERFAPAAALVAAGRWESLVSLPLVVRGAPLGVLAAFYSAGHRPGDAEVSFLTAMADQAAMAVHTARLLTALEHRSSDALAPGRR